MKKILVLGGTGAMGVYLVPELIKMGYQVDVVSQDDVQSQDVNLRYFKADAYDDEYLSGMLKNGYDGIVDFMIYRTPRFRERHPLLLSHTDHYIYLSSYRIYAGSYPITEESDRLLDVATEPNYLASEDYSLYKARGEDILSASKYDNWTTIRPAITYSQRRFQLVTLEAPVVVHRMRAGKKVVLPEAALDIQATMSWAGDVGKMIARLLFNPRAYKEKFTVATSEHHSWREIAAYYRELGGLEFVPASIDDYVRMVGGAD